MDTEKENRGTVVLSFLCVPKKGCTAESKKREEKLAIFTFLSLSLVYIISSIDGFQIKITSAVISDYVPYQAQK